MNGIIIIIVIVVFVMVIVSTIIITTSVIAIISSSSVHSCLLLSMFDILSYTYTTYVYMCSMCISHMYVA